MTNWNIRERIFILAILPVSFFAASLIFYLYTSISLNHDKNTIEHSYSLAKKLASVAEGGVYLRDPDHLRSIAVAILDEKDIISVNFFDIDGEFIAGSETTTYPLNTSPLDTSPSLLDNDQQQLTVVAPISMYRFSINSDSSKKPDTLITTQTDSPSHQQVTVGWVSVVVSKEAANARAHHDLTKILAPLGLLLVTTILLALLLGRSVVNPMLRVQQAIHAINTGNLGVRLPMTGGSDMRHMAENFNAMADMLHSHRAVLETRISEATRTLEERKNEAEQASLAKSRFLAAASHDLRQPLHALTLFISDLQIASDNPSHQALLIDKIVMSVHQISNLLDTLLDISKLDMANVTPTLSSVTLNDLLYRLQISFGRSASEHGLRLRVITQPHKIHTDLSLMERLLSNLLANAIRYTPSGKVLVTTRRTSDPNLLRIEVRDSGIGISVEHQQAIFEEFFQVGNSARDSGKGLGLGLTIVKRIAEILNLKIGLRSQPGKGSVFWVEVPRITTAAIKKTAPMPSGPLLLLLGLDGETQRMLEETVHPWGYRTICDTQSYIRNKKNEWPKTIITNPQTASTLDSPGNITIPMIIVAQQDESIDTSMEYWHHIFLPIRPARLRALLPRFTT